MSACEACWNEAFVRSRTRGTSQVDEYQKLIAKREHEPAAARVDEEGGEG